jgi:hypothetical protein
VLALALGGSPAAGAVTAGRDRECGSPNQGGESLGVADAAVHCSSDEIRGDRWQKGWSFSLALLSWHGGARLPAQQESVHVARAQLFTVEQDWWSGAVCAGCGCIYCICMAVGTARHRWQ